MLEKLKGIRDRNEELLARMSEADVIRDPQLMKKYAREQAQTGPIADRFDDYSKLLGDIAGSRELLETETDEEILEMAREDLEQLEERRQSMEENFRMLLIPKDENDERNVILEIRAGTGGEEAALFGGDLLRMYTRFAERHNFTVETLSSNVTELGGVKEIVLLVSGRDVYARLKYESGVHRVQRVPDTESSGRIHTSAATVAVLPEAEEVEVDISPNDLRIDVYRSSGHGGQSVNTTDSAVRITHLPTGTVVSCQDEKSQIKNKAKAMKVLASRLYERYQQEAASELSANRRQQVGSGDRSERIRTYNFPQGRVTDHRIGLTLYQLPAFLDGDMDEVITALAQDEMEKKLAAADE
ncbi:MAG: peptide chain release factor 1 [Clostridia bacterium]|nr:peptide chain release factor 1 [Clostridia bacterium]